MAGTRCIRTPRGREGGSPPTDGPGAWASHYALPAPGLSLPPRLCGGKPCWGPAQTLPWKSQTAEVRGKPVLRGAGLVPEPRVHPPVLFPRTQECRVLHCEHRLFIATAGDITSQPPEQEGTQTLGPEEQGTRGTMARCPCGPLCVGVCPHACARERCGCDMSRCVLHVCDSRAGYLACAG